MVFKLSGDGGAAEPRSEDLQVILRSMRNGDRIPEEQWGKMVGQCVQNVGSGVAPRVCVASELKMTVANARLDVSWDHQNTQKRTGVTDEWHWVEECHARPVYMDEQSRGTHWHFGELLWVPSVCRNSLVGEDSQERESESDHMTRGVPGGPALSPLTGSRAGSIHVFKEVVRNDVHWDREEKPKMLRGACGSAG